MYFKWCVSQVPQKMLKKYKGSNIPVVQCTTTDLQIRVNINKIKAQFFNPS